MWNVEKPLLRHDAMHGKTTVRQADGGTALRGWKKQMPLCSGVDKACNTACVKPSAFGRGETARPRPTGVPLRESLENPLKMGKQMTASASALTLVLRQATGCETGDLESGEESPGR